jgi:hypothetical protein
MSLIGLVLPLVVVGVLLWLLTQLRTDGFEDQDNHQRGRRDRRRLAPAGLRAARLIDLNEAGRARRPRGLVRAALSEPPARLVGEQARPRRVELREERVDGAVERRHGESPLLSAIRRCPVAPVRSWPSPGSYSWHGCRYAINFAIANAAAAASPPTTAVCQALRSGF